MRVDVALAKWPHRYLRRCLEKYGWLQHLWVRSRCGTALALVMPSPGRLSQQWYEAAWAEYRALHGDEEECLCRWCAGGLLGTVERMLAGLHRRISCSLAAAGAHRSWLAATWEWRREAERVEAARSWHASLNMASLACPAPPPALPPSCHRLEPPPPSPPSPFPPPAAAAGLRLKPSDFLRHGSAGLPEELQADAEALQRRCSPFCYLLPAVDPSPGFYLFWCTPFVPPIVPPKHRPQGDDTGICPTLYLYLYLSSRLHS